MARDFALLQIYRFDIYVNNKIDCILKRADYQLDIFYVLYSNSKTVIRYFAIKNGLGRFQTIF